MVLLITTNDFYEISFRYMEMQRTNLQKNKSIAPTIMMAISVATHFITTPATFQRCQLRRIRDVMEDVVNPPWGSTKPLCKLWYFIGFHFTMIHSNSDDSHAFSAFLGMSMVKQ